MARTKKTYDKLIVTLEERVRELNCIFEIEELLNKVDLTSEEVLNRIVEILPRGFQFTEICRIKIEYRESVYLSSEFRESPWKLSEELKVQERSVGSVDIYYIEECPPADNGPFLKEEVEMLRSIAHRLGHYLMYQKLKLVFNKWETTIHDMNEKKSVEWQVVLDLLRRTDLDLYIRISRKMLNFLVWRGVAESEQLLQEFNPLRNQETVTFLGETNMPMKKQHLNTSEKVSQEIFKIAQKYLNNDEILSNIQKWMAQDKTSFLVRATSNNDTSLTDISEAIRKYFQIAPGGLELMPSARIGVRAAMIRRFFSEQLEFINIAKSYVKISDFDDILKRTIFPTGSHGKLGGKSAGVFLAYKILEHTIDSPELLETIRMPKTWYITSDTLIHFMHFNNLEEILEQKYKEIDEVRKEYPHVVQLFKNSHFPPEIVQGLSMALDDFGTNPLIVRSSSLLEDRLGSAFSGKYKSLFLANQGSKHARLDALTDAIAEVYASTIGPDPIEYRAERGLLDFHEEMGIMIQEVVGIRVEDYFFPSFAGVAFSNNEFRWSPRIKREDGLIRLVPGLGTRAVDRLSDDYPILIAPGQPNLKANVSINEIVRYSPQKIDIINLKSNQFETKDLSELFEEFGNDYPAIEKVVSIFEQNHIRKPFGINIDYNKEDLVVTFDGLIKDTFFIQLLNRMLKDLQSKLETPVDIEFASNGKQLYLLQCRPQSYSKYDAPSPIPDNIPKENLIFSASKYISNGMVPEISHIVYVDPLKYLEIVDRRTLETIGKVVSRLNKILPKRKFILMGPGRWGSRGDIKLGVSVTYSDINNCAVLIEIAKKKGNYLPDLSFGTHFFQDLVESSIRYLPLYPDDKENTFNESFFLETANKLTELLPEYAYLEKVIKVIDINSVKSGFVLRVLMNADIDRAVAMLSPEKEEFLPGASENTAANTHTISDFEWREKIAYKIASQLDPERFGVQEMYLTGSTKTQAAQPGSDIDLIVKFKGNAEQKEKLKNWLEGWSLCLDEFNFQRTGYKAGGLLDVRFYDDLSKQERENTINLKKLTLAIPRNNSK